MASYEFVTTWCIDTPIGGDARRAPHLIEGQATGGLGGIRTWRLYRGEGTAVIDDWRGRTTKPWMNIHGALARPVFAWDHDVVMRQGGEGLAAELGSRLLLHD